MRNDWVEMTKGGGGVELIGGIRGCIFKAACSARLDERPPNRVQVQPRIQVGGISALQYEYRFQYYNIILPLDCISVFLKSHLKIASCLTDVG